MESLWILDLIPDTCVWNILCPNILHGSIPRAPVSVKISNEKSKRRKKRRAAATENHLYQ